MRTLTQIHLHLNALAKATNSEVGEAWAVALSNIDADWRLIRQDQPKEIQEMTDDRIEGLQSRARRFGYA